MWGSNCGIVLQVSSLKPTPISPPPCTNKKCRDVWCTLANHKNYTTSTDPAMRHGVFLDDGSAQLWWAVHAWTYFNEQSWAEVLLNWSLPYTKSLALSRCSKRNSKHNLQDFYHDCSLEYVHAYVASHSLAEPSSRKTQCLITGFEEAVYFLWSGSVRLQEINPFPLILCNILSSWTNHTITY